MVQLRRVKHSDLTTLTKIKINAFSEEFKKYGFTPNDLISPEWHKKMMNDSIYYAVVEDDKIVGGVNIFKIKDDAYYLCSLYIDKELQNQGLGTRTIQLLEDEYPHVKRWMLETPSMSINNRIFYEKCGYNFIKEDIPRGAPEGFTLRQYEKIII